MLEITQQEILDRLAFDNPWWAVSDGISPVFDRYPRRIYFEPFLNLVADKTVNRAIILMGPRRVGKTVMVYHTIKKLLDQGVPGDCVLYLSLETPVYTGLPLERLLLLFREQFSHGRNHSLYIFFDEIQYFKDWEVHLKSLVDSYPEYRFVATGSAAAALRLKSQESGAGRFTDFLLPPLSFVEYLRFTDQENELIESPDKDQDFYQTKDIQGLNRAFVDYLNFGGYPEAVFIETVRNESARFIKNDIIDKVLLRDLPSLYGINDIQELNRLFTVLAYNTGNEISYEGLTKQSGVAKNTVKRYLEYLEAAFLIKPLYSINQSARRLQRVGRFKVYLANPSMRAALFGPVDADAEAMGTLTETAIISQWFHSFVMNRLHYARWKDGEVDIVAVDPVNRSPIGCIEIKWSDRSTRNYGDLYNLTQFARQNDVNDVSVTTRTVSSKVIVDGIEIKFVPSSLVCYSVSRNVIMSQIGPLMKRPQD